MCCCRNWCSCGSGCNSNEGSCGCNGNGSGNGNGNGNGVQPVCGWEYVCRFPNFLRSAENASLNDFRFFEESSGSGCGCGCS